MIINVKEKILALGAFCILGTAAPSLSAPYFTYYANVNGNLLDMNQYIDFAADGIHGTYSTFPANGAPNPGTVGAKFFPIFLANDLTTSGQCLEIKASMANSQPTPDPKFWIKNFVGGGGYVAVSDDFSGYFPALRVWLRSTATSTVGATLYAAAFTSNYNSMDFYVSIDRKNLSELACTSSQAAPVLPWVKLIGDVMTTGAYK
jgi:hypothetical protein